MKLNMEQEMKQNSQESKPFTKHWSGYLSIGIAFALAALVLILSIGSAYGTNTAPVKKMAFAESSVSENLPVIVMAEELPQNTMENTVDVAEVDTVNADTAEVAEEVWHFYNLDLQDDGKILNDYDFGPNPILENIDNDKLNDKLKEAIKGKKASDTITMKVEDIVEMQNAEELKAEQIRRMRDDPKLGAADMAWMDSILGTRFLGTFYSAAKEQWDVAMNDAADTWIADPEAYNKALDNFERKLNHANEVKIEYRKSGLKDQMYMEPDGKNEGVPDIVVMETTNHDGYFLVYTYIIKETKTLEVAYRIDCGFQPTNVAEIMKVKAKKNPNKKTPKPNPTPAAKQEFIPVPVIVNGQTTIVWQQSSSSSSHDHVKHPDPDSKKKDPDPIRPDIPPISNPKDPTEGTPVLPNDTTGPGTNTIDPIKPDQSTADKPTNSNHMTPDEYDKAIKDLESANQPGGGSEGGTPNTPSTSAPPDTTVDSKADEGTGYGGIDQPTEVKESSQSDKEPCNNISEPDSNQKSSGKSSGHSSGKKDNLQKSD